MTVENIGSAWHFPPGGGNKLPQTCDIQLQFKKRKKKKYIYKTEPNPPPKTKALSMLADFQGILNIKFNFRLLGFLFFSFFYKVNHIQGGTEWLNVQQLKKATANRKKMQKHTKCIYLT